MNAKKIQYYIHMTQIKFWYNLLKEEVMQTCCADMMSYMTHYKMQVAAKVEHNQQ